MQEIVTNTVIKKCSSNDLAGLLQKELVFLTDSNDLAIVNNSTTITLYELVLNRIKDRIVSFNI